MKPTMHRYMVPSNEAFRKSLSKEPGLSTSSISLTSAGSTLAFLKCSSVVSKPHFHFWEIPRFFNFVCLGQGKQKTVSSKCFQLLRSCLPHCVLGLAAIILALLSSPKQYIASS